MKALPWYSVCVLMFYSVAHSWSFICSPIPLIILGFLFILLILILFGISGRACDKGGEVIGCIWNDRDILWAYCCAVANHRVAKVCSVVKFLAVSEFPYLCCSFNISLVMPSLSMRTSCETFFLFHYHTTSKPEFLWKVF